MSWNEVEHGWTMLNFLPLFRYDSFDWMVDLSCCMVVFGCQASREAGDVTSMWHQCDQWPMCSFTTRSSDDRFDRFDRTAFALVGSHWTELYGPKMNKYCGEWRLSRSSRWSSCNEYKIDKIGYPWAQKSMSAIVAMWSACPWWTTFWPSHLFTVLATSLNVGGPWMVSPSNDPTVIKKTMLVETTFWQKWLVGGISEIHPCSSGWTYNQSANMAKSYQCLSYTIWPGDP